MVKVHNRGKDYFRDMYDGVILELPPGEAKIITDQMAQHCFGYGDDDKRRALSRLGWLKSEDRSDGVPYGWKEAMARLGHFVFTPQVLVDQDGASDAGRLPHASSKAAA